MLKLAIACYGFTIFCLVASILILATAHAQPCKCTSTSTKGIVLYLHGRSTAI